MITQPINYFRPLLGKLGAVTIALLLLTALGGPTIKGQNKGTPLGFLASPLTETLETLGLGTDSAGAAVGGKQELVINSRACYHRGGIKYMNVFTDASANWWSGRTYEEVSRTSMVAHIRGIRGNWRGPYSFHVTVHVMCRNGEWFRQHGYVPRNRSRQFQIWV